MTVIIIVFIWIIISVIIISLFQVGDGAHSDVNGTEFA